jgi:hypothetical protein
MKTKRFLWAVAPLLAGLAQPVDAGTTPPIVVELFTSQGCNSCPPADALLGELAKRGDLVPLAFHVDYWDYIGWKDPYALADATARQRAYAEALGQRMIYTPQMVIQGQRDEVGSDRGAVAKAIKDVLKPSVAVTLNRGTDRLTIEVGEGTGPGELWLVGYDRRHETKVLRGENAGRTLAEYNIVRQIRRVGAWTGTKLRLEIPAAEMPEGGAQAALLQAPGLGPILGAATLAAATD